ncbi:MAG: glycosyltransferase family 4 protein [Phycisphaerae bacterium]
MTESPHKNRGVLLIFSQTFAPDPAAVGQHVTDAAIELARRGHRVRVYASSRGYEDPSRRYPLRENMQAVEVRRLRWSSFGKKNLLIRMIGTASFLIQCFCIGLFTPRVKGILFSTSPPMIGFAAAWIHLLRRVPIAYWAMDLNPDQLIMMGKIKNYSLRARFLEVVNRFILRNSAVIFALDRFMAERLAKRGDLAQKIYIDPPWPHEHVIEPVPPENNPFRIEHGLLGKLVLMYSGNHSPANPLDTILQAAAHFKDDPQLRFVFVGGGLGKRQVESYKKDHQLSNVISLPYQPLETLKFSLAAADVHLVSLGENMVGIIHPCKIYGAMAVGKPILFLGPDPSHIADIFAQHRIGWRIRHGDVNGAVAVLAEIKATAPAELQRMGREAQHLLHERFSQEALCGRFCDRLEKALFGSTE